MAEQEKLVEQKKRQKIEAILDEIYDCIGKNPEHLQNKFSLMHGRLGALVFLLYYSKHKSDKLIQEEVDNYFDKYIEELAFERLGPAFANGVSGVLYTLKLLNDNKLVDLDVSEVTETLNDYILSFLDVRDFEDGNYDFFYGFIGVGIYAIAENSDKLLKPILSALDASKQIDKNGIKWKQVFYDDENKDRVVFNISLPHGLSSIVIFLSKLYKVNADSMITELTTGTVNYILSQEIDSKYYGSMFPMTSQESQIEIFGSRLAWCYGDLCIAMALWQAGKAFDNPEWKDKALNIFSFNAKRRNEPINGVADACLCHGSAGLAQIYRRMYFETGIEEFMEVSDYWIDVTINYAQFPDGYAGYKAKVVDGYSNEILFLEGISGIGLSLLASIEQEDFSTWDRLLLIS